MDAGGQTLFLGAHTGLFRSDDRGRSWNKVSLSTKHAHLDVMDVAPDPRESKTIYIATHEAGIFKSTDGGKTWKHLGLADSELQRTVYALATTAGLAPPDNPLDRLEPRAVADELGRAWPRFATALASRQPTILVVEDLHWAGEPLIELLDRVVARAAGPLLVIATARPELTDAHPGLGNGREGMTSITLQSLTQAEAAALVSGQLPAADVPDVLQRTIVETAEGNPFFLEEIVLGLVDTGAIVVAGDGWRATAATERAVSSARSQRYATMGRPAVPMLSEPSRLVTSGTKPCQGLMRACATMLAGTASMTCTVKL